MTTKSITTPPQPNKMPGFTGESALPPSSVVSAIGCTGIRYYPNSPKKSESADPQQ